MLTWERSSPLSVSQLSCLSIFPSQQCQSACCSCEVKVAFRSLFCRLFAGRFLVNDTTNIIAVWLNRVTLEATLLKAVSLSVTHRGLVLAVAKNKETLAACQFKLDSMEAEYSLLSDKITNVRREEWRKNKPPPPPNALVGTSLMPMCSFIITLLTSHSSTASLLEMERLRKLQSQTQPVRHFVRGPIPREEIPLSTPRQPVHWEFPLEREIRESKSRLRSLIASMTPALASQALPEPQLVQFVPAPVYVPPPSTELVVFAPTGISFGGVESGDMALVVPSQDVEMADASPLQQLADDEQGDLEMAYAVSFFSSLYPPSHFS